MIIDFHTHVFPDPIASKTIEFLSGKGGIPPFSDGSVQGLLNKMNDADIDCAVTLPVLTNPLKFESVNRFAAEINTSFANKSKKLISFASIHPQCDEIDKKMAWIKNSGFKGVKIHPDYQGTFINDEKYVKIMECAKEYDLIVVTHAGFDGGYKDQPMRCTPILAKELIRRVPHSKLVLAHMGANTLYDSVLSLLCDEDVYFDTAYVLRSIGKEKFLEILRKRGADRILFASDSPWSDIGNDAEILRSFSLEKDVEDKIFYQNAKNLLGI